MPEAAQAKGKDKEHEGPKPLVRALGIAGLILVLLLGAWGIITVSLSLPSAFGDISSSFGSLFSGNASSTSPGHTGLFSGPSEDLTVSGPSNDISSGAPFTLSWSYGGTADSDYSYAISYACTDGFSLKAPLPTGAYQSVACDMPFNYTGAKSSLTLIPQISGTEHLQVPFTVAATRLSDTVQTASGKMTLSFAPGASARAGSAAPQSAKGSVKYLGAADLSVRITSVTATGVQFEIRNVGGATAPAGWLFTVALPLSPAYTYISAPQRAVVPGGYILNTLDWDGYMQNQNCGYQYQTYPYMNYYQPYRNCSGGYNYAAGSTVTVTVDPHGAVADANRANNAASAPVY